MRLIVGLGNPGSRYQNTRHNVGHLVVDQLARQLGLEWRKGKFAQLASNRDLCLAKLDAFMNDSGPAVQKVLSELSHRPDEMIVAYDEVDLPFGLIKFKHAGSANGHHGIESIDQVLGDDYWRLRVGIGRPAADESRASMPLDGYVLADWTADEQLRLPQVVDRTGQFLIELLKEDKLEVNQFNAQEN